MEDFGISMSLNDFFTFVFFICFCFYFERKDKFKDVQGKDLLKVVDCWFDGLKWLSWVGSKICFQNSTKKNSNRNHKNLVCFTSIWANQFS